MIENREAWLDAIFSVEGGWSNHPEDTGRETMMGITLATFREWRGEDVSAADLKAITKQECSEIYLARYWNAVRGDQLPSGLDVYAADFAVSSGPGRAAAKLQALIGTKVDTFIAEKTLAAVRSKDPLQLLLDYHQARMEFLMSLEKWPTFGRGWTNRCSKILAISRPLIRSRPGIKEAVTSRTVQASVAAAGAGATALVERGFSIDDLVDWVTQLAHSLAPSVSGLPDMLQSIEPQTSAALEHANQVAATPGMAGNISAVISIALSLYAGWCRIYDWRAGKR